MSKNDEKTAKSASKGAGSWLLIAALAIVVGTYAYTSHMLLVFIGGMTLLVGIAVLLKRLVRRGRQ